MGGTTVLIVGAGPAAAGAALAAIKHPDVHVTILDIGGRLEHANEDARSRMALDVPLQWDRDDVRLVGRLAVDSAIKGLPQKRAFGSDFPFRDFGQLDKLTAEAGVNDALVSGAYGGFSNVWGAQIMPFSAATFREWPVRAEEMRLHYASILREIPYAADEDDLATLFPLLESATALPTLSDRSQVVLARYRRNRIRLNRHGITIGRARLAMKANECVRCGLCLTGCPYRLIYSASQTLDKLRRRGQIEYHEGLLAIRVEETASAASVTARDLRTSRIRQFDADHVLLACGAIGTSRIVMGSLDLYETPARVAESAQFILPFVSSAGVPDPQQKADFTLNQFNMVLDLDARGHDIAQLHFYTYNASVAAALPAILRSRRMRGVRAELLRRLSVALGYLPSWASPGFSICAHAAHDSTSLPVVKLSSCPAFGGTSLLRPVLRRVAFAAPYLDLWPVLPMLRVPARGKSYHWGGTFPHSAHACGRFSSDVLGRVAPWKRIHLVDASVFPTIPATTFTLTLMANAHRIADAIHRSVP